MLTTSPSDTLDTDDLHAATVRSQGHKPPALGSDRTVQVRVYVPEGLRDDMVRRCQRLGTSQQDLLIRALAWELYGHADTFEPNTIGWLERQAILQGDDGWRAGLRTMMRYFIERYPRGMVLHPPRNLDERSVPPQR